MKATKPEWYDLGCETMALWHIRDDGTLDYTIYTPNDGGVIDLQEDVTLEEIYELLEESV